jgi:hypothetical protein
LGSPVRPSQNEEPPVRLDRGKSGNNSDGKRLVTPLSSSSARRSSAAEFTPDAGNLEVLIERMPAAALR